MDKKKIAGIVLVLAGLSFIFYAAFTEWSHINKEKELRAAFEETIAPEVEPVDPLDNVDPSLIESIKAPEGEATAVISIPRIGLEVAMVEVDMEKEMYKLDYAVGHFPETVNPGEKGNFAVAGHRNWMTGAFFARLDELQPGDKIHVKTKNSFCTYSVTESFIVKPEDVWVLDPTEDSVVTLVTCTIGAKERLIVKGVLEGRSAS